MEAPKKRAPASEAGSQQGNEFDVQISIVVTKCGKPFFDGSLRYTGMDLGQVVVAETAMADVGRRLADVGIKQAEMLGFQGIKEAIEALE